MFDYLVHGVQFQGLVRTFASLLCGVWMRGSFIFSQATSAEPCILSYKYEVMREASGMGEGGCDVLLSLEASR